MGALLRAPANAREGHLGNWNHTVCPDCLETALPHHPPSPCQGSEAPDTFTSSLSVPCRSGQTSSLPSH